MAYRMSDFENEQYLQQFKKFFLELLYWYWQLSDDNPFFRKFRNSTGMSISDYSRHIAKQKMTIVIMQECVNVLRDVFDMAIKSEVTVVQPRVIEVSFNLFLTKEI